MKRFSYLLIMMIFALVVAVGCSDPKQEESSDVKEEQTTAAFPVTMTDGLGEEITIKEEPKKIVSLIPSNTEVMFALGAGDKLVGVSDFDNYPEEAANIEKIGGMEINTEKIISLKPDLVLAHASNAHNGAEGVKQLQDMGITVLTVNDAKSFDEVYTSIEMLGKATGKSEAAAGLISDMKSKLADIEEKAKAVKDDERKKVFVEVSPAPDLFSPGKNTFMNEMLEIIGADSVTGEKDGWVQMSEEAVVKANPDVIVTTYGFYTENPEKLVKSRNGWSDVSAIKNNQIFDVHSDKVTRSGPRLIEGVEELAKAIYPNVFN